MARSPYTLLDPGGLAQSIFNVLDVGRRLVALAADRGLHLEVQTGPAGLDCLKVTAVPLNGAPQVVGQVLRPATADLRNRVALAVALAQSDRAGRRLAKAA